MSATNTTSGKSTFGVELEFLAAVDDNHHCTPHHAVYEVLQEPVSVPCPFNCEEGEHILRLPVDDRPPSFWEFNQNKNPYNAWVVGRDCSVKLNADERQLLPDSHLISDIEIPSRILDFNNPSPCPHGQFYPCNGEPLMWNWQDEISAIINTLKTKCNRPGWRVFVNGTCGLHVHIGREKFGFNLDTTKNVMAMFTAFERCFDAILPVDRICGYENDHAPLPSLQLTPSARSSTIPWSESPGIKYSLPHSARQYEHLGHDLMNAYESADFLTWNTLVRNPNIPYWLHLLYNTESITALGEYSTSHISWVNLQHLVYKDSKPTIEIRLHPGSLEADEIISWIDFLCNLFFYAESTPTDSVSATLEANFANPNYTILDICRLVNASPATIAHYTSFLSGTYHTARASNTLALQPTDVVTPLHTSVLSTRSNQHSLPATSSRILSKLISGRYGQFPTSFLNSVLPANVLAGANADAWWLNDIMDAQGQDSWDQECHRVVHRAVARKNGVPGHELDNIFD